MAADATEEAVRAAALQAVRSLRVMYSYVQTLDPRERARLAAIVRSDALDYRTWTHEGAGFCTDSAQTTKRPDSHDREPGL